MAAIVCQGLQSCLESQLIESRTYMRLRLCSSKPNVSQSLELVLKPCSLSSKTKELSQGCHHDEDNLASAQNPDMGGWSLLQDLPYTSKESTEKANSYVHPLMKRNSSTLSKKSLELCTENLGSETGTIDVVDNSIFTSSSSSSSLSSLVSESEAGNSPTREQSQQKPRQLLVSKKASNNIRSFPPPLTTISGSKSLQVMPHREDGRLVIKAVEAPSKHSYFQADRSEGRLRLRLVKDSASCFDLDEESEATNTANNGNLETENDPMNSDEEGEVEEEEVVVEDEEEEDDFEEEEENGTYIGREIEGNNTDVGAEIGKEKFQRLTRCKEGEVVENNGLLLNLRPRWVATS